MTKTRNRVTIHPLWSSIPARFAKPDCLDQFPDAESQSMVYAKPMAKRLTEKFERGMQFAIRAHHRQVRKGSGAPYISHPIAVASIVLEYGGSETQAIGALLHDVVEDCGITQAELQRRFGAKVARIVVECSDYIGPKTARKPAWRTRKERYIAELLTVAEETLLVSAADKLHNARAIVHDVKHFGPVTWTRFHAEPSQILWYYRSLLAVYHQRGHASLKTILVELELAISQLAISVRRAKPQRAAR